MNREQIKAKVDEVVREANRKWPSLNLVISEVSFFSKGSVAGLAHYEAAKLEFNEVLARENSESFVNTVIHEISHLVVYRLCPNFKQHHGPEFKSVCRSLGGDGKTGHQYDVASVKTYKMVKRWVAKCGCREHKLTLGESHKAHKGILACRSCHRKLELVGKAVRVRSNIL